jgi:hypothetical protein
MATHFLRTPFVSIDGMRRIGDTMVDLEWVRRGFTLIGKANCVVVVVGCFPVNFVTIVKVVNLIGLRLAIT